MTKKNWWNKGVVNRGRVRLSIKPGACVSVDQLESTTPGFVAQLKGRLTKDRYRCATIFLDDYSSLSYANLQRSTDGEGTVDAKKIFEVYARSKGIIIQHYHADNSRFEERKWTDNVQQ